MIRQFLLFLSFIVVISCDSGDSAMSKTVWIGGEIVNPKSNIVVIYKDDCIIDTVKLNNKNFFLYKGEGLPEGLYSFRHNEFQLFYVEPGDSLMLRVNTVDFDESLTYTGKGAKKNNFLMELFLLNEIENKLVSNWYRLTPTLFEKKLDSLKGVRNKLYSEFTQKYNPSEGLQKLIKSNIDFDYFSKKEMYTSANVWNKLNNRQAEYPDDFYNYRQEVDFGCEELMSYYPYYRFLNRLFDNLAIERHQNYTNLRKYSYEHCLSKVRVIDSLVTNTTFKNNLLRSSVMHYLVNAKDAQKEKDIVAHFLRFNTNKDHHKEIQSLAEATLKLTSGNKIPNVLLVNTDNTVKELHSYVKRPTVLYFWSSKSVKHYKDIHSKVATLNSKFPNYDFIGINTDTHFKKWREIVINTGYNKNLEFQLENLKEAEKKLVINSMNKAIIIDDSSIILENNTNLFGKTIEKHLSEYSN